MWVEKRGKGYRVTLKEKWNEEMGLPEYDLRIEGEDHVWGITLLGDDLLKLLIEVFKEAEEELYESKEVLI